MKKQLPTFPIPKWLQIVAILEERQTSKSNIAKKVDATYSYVVNVLHETNRRRWTAQKKIGRQYEVYLTEDGKIIAQAANTLIGKIGRKPKEAR